MTHIVHSKLRHIFKLLNVRKYNDIAMKFCDNDEIMLFYNIINKNNVQIGGANTVEITYMNEQFTFHVVKENECIYYNLHKNNNVNNIPECLIIVINKKNNFAYINGISYDDECFSVNSIRKSGSTLLKIALALISKLKEKYDLKYIQLKDNSRKQCKKNKKYINLWAINMFTSGDTWYGKYGFIPYDTDTLNIDIENCKKYLYNKKIITTTKIKNTNIIKYLEIASKELKLKIDDNIFKQMKDKYANSTINEFFDIFLKKFDKYCEIFSHVYEKLIVSIKLYNLHNMVYFKKL